MQRAVKNPYFPPYMEGYKKVNKIGRIAKKGGRHKKKEKNFF